jgi:hypothetical protein
LFVAIFLCSTVSSQAAGSGINFFRNYFVTGDYVVGSVDLQPQQAVSGLVSGDISITGVPDNADILAAFLYFEIITNTEPTNISNAYFRGEQIGPSAVKIGSSGLNPSTAPCWAKQGQTVGAATTWRVDVLRHLPVDNNPASPTYRKRLVNSEDVPTPHTVQLPDAGTGNQLPEAAGASLVVVYRDPDPNKPLTGIVLFDGFRHEPVNTTMLQTLYGWFEKKPNALGKLTQIVSSGQPNPSEVVKFNGATQTSITNPFNSSPSSQRGWKELTIPSLNMNGTGSGTYHDQVTTEVSHTDTTAEECLAWSAFQFSVPVLDTDEDGALDFWEDSNTPVPDPAGGFLPDIKAMGANKNVQDIFVEIGYMATSGYQNVAQTVTLHDHLPAQVGVLDRVAAAYQNAKPRKLRSGGNSIGCGNTMPATGFICGPIKIHFDGGNRYTAASYIIPFVHGDGNPCTAPGQGAAGHTSDTLCLARGGEEINEVVGCETVNGNTTCGDPEEDDFTNWPGTVGWKSGFNVLKNQPLGYVPTPQNPLSIEEQCQADPTCQRRFDRNRRHIFKYALFAHALGLVRVDAQGIPVLDAGGETQPKNTSGISDGGLGGGDLMVTLGLWEDFEGTDFMQASTFLHELGHGLGLQHGGGQPVTLSNGTRAGQPNCKPNYLSIMNYSFQVRGLYLANGTGPVIDYSSQVLGPTVTNGVVASLNESSLSEANGLRTATNNEAMAYRTSWYAPLQNVNNAVQFVVTRYCNGTNFLGGTPLVRVDGTTVTPPIDWNVDGAPTTTPQQDVNFNGVFNDGDPESEMALSGSNDFLNMDLRQTASRRNSGSDRIGGGLSLDVGFGEVGFGEVGFGDLGFPDQGFGEVGFGEVGFGEVGFGEVGFGEVGFGEVGFGEVGAPQGDLDLDTAASLDAPANLKATSQPNSILLTWNPPHVAPNTVTGYDVFKIVGALTSTSVIQRLGTLSPTVPATTTQFVDTNVKNKVKYTYFVVAQRPNGPTGPSNFVTITK